MRSRSIHPSHPDYPEPLRAAFEPGDDPPVLRLRGALPAAVGVAIVGTRAASDEAIRFARALARDLGEAGYAIWSGGARGVDRAAHEGALEAGAPTVVVMGGGLDRPYPPEHRPLFAAVLDAGGALLARVPDDAQPLPLFFLQRNVVLAALTAATVVVQAGVESGARSTAAAARRLGRPLCVVPHAPWDPRGVGCALELLAGARAITRARDVLEALGAPPPPPLPPRRRARRPERARSLALPLRAADATGPEAAARGPSASYAPAPGSDERVVLDALGGAPAHVDEICERTGLCLGRIAGALLTLTLEAVVVEGPAGSYRRALRC